MIFKCKICGGTLELNENQTTVVCEYCGVNQTLPKFDGDNKLNLYDRANHFRRNNEFDKAMSIYETILNSDNTDAEAYWSLVLCKYGVEYVEDPEARKRVPTVNRAQFTSIFDDSNYKSALEYADAEQKTIYEEEAKAINEIQRGILAISQKEEPFDVFICYKETDNNGKRTQDSVLANDLYHQLTQEGFKVFFSKITLENNLGTAYEPYIFAALNSAKVMVVLGTKPEYFNAVWVKNEWSRYLSIVNESNGKKILIPAYKDIDPYDLPEEFSHLQAQDMTKLGFMQDLIRGIKKILDTNTTKSTVKETVIVNSGSTNIDTLLKRMFMCLNEGEFAKADSLCEQILNIDPENGDAYIGKLLAECKCESTEKLNSCSKSFSNSNNYKSALRFSSPENISKLRKYAENVDIADKKIRDKKKKVKKIVCIFSISIFICIALSVLTLCFIIPTIKYNQALTFFEMENYDEAIVKFEDLNGYKDSEIKIKESKYNKSIKLIEIGKHIEAIPILRDLKNYNNSSIILRNSYIKLSETISAGELHTVGLKNDGTIVAVGDNEYNQCDVSGWNDIVAVSAGYNHTVGLKSDGTVVAVGDNHYGKCNAMDFEGIIAISATADYTIGLKSDGTVVAVGNDYHDLSYVNYWKDIVSIAAKYRYAVGLKSDGTVVAAGDNDHGQCDVSDWKDIVAISTGVLHTVGLKSDGTVVAIGNDEYGQCDVLDWEDIVAISAGDFHTIGLKSDGTVVAIGNNYDGQCNVSDWKDIVAISAGYGHTVGLKSDGTVVAIGWNSAGQCDVKNFKNIGIQKNN